MSPETTRLDRARPSRLIPAEHSVPVLGDLVDGDDEFAALTDLEGATNRRLSANVGALPGIDPRELVHGVPYASFINAAFTYARPGGGRFSTARRGAWYAAFDIETALAEVIHHHAAWLAEVGRYEDESRRDEWLADFSGDFHDIRGDDRFADCLAPDDYGPGQALAARLLADGGLGLIYPSVRGAGDNLVCFRPGMVANVQKGRGFVLRWSGDPDPMIEEAF